MKSKYFDVEKVIENMQLGRSKFVLIPDQTLVGEIYRSLLKRKNQIILECGVNRGLTSSVFTYYCEKNESHCFSIDIKDCSEVVDSDSWTFIKNDDTDVSGIINDYPVLDQKGIDILYVDSLHTADHVMKVLYNWYPYMNKDSLIFIDDIDARVFRKGNPKDSIISELNWNEINQFTIDFVDQNYFDTTLTQYYGKTGLAKISKVSEKGSKPKPIIKRKRLIGALFIVKILKKIKMFTRS